MIRRLTVWNYRSLGEAVTVDFEPLTVLVGPNGSGKSNVLDALLFLGDAARIGLSGALSHRHGIAAVRRWSASHPYDIWLHLELQEGDWSASYHLGLKGADDFSVKYEMAEVRDGAVVDRFRVEADRGSSFPEGLRPSIDDQSLALLAVGGDARFSRLVSALQGIAVYTIFPDTLRQPQKYDNVKPMDRHGANWASVLKDQPKESWRPDLIAALRKLTGDMADVKVSPAASYLVVQFRHEAGAKGRKAKWFDSAQESDGTLRVAGILTALLQSPPVPVIAIEEPELTVHPGAIPLLYDFIRDASSRSQVIVTTHSPELLDLVDPTCVRVVERRLGITSVSRMDDSQRASVRDRLLTVGEILRTEGLMPHEAAGVAEE